MLSAGEKWRKEPRTPHSASAFVISNDHDLEPEISIIFYGKTWGICLACVRIRTQNRKIHWFFRPLWSTPYGKSWGKINAVTIKAFLPDCTQDTEFMTAACLTNTISCSVQNIFMVGRMMISSATWFDRNKVYTPTVCPIDSVKARWKGIWR